MKLSTLFSFMGIEMTIKGDVEYEHGIKLEGLDITFHKPETPPTNEEMEKAANEFIEFQGKRDLELQKNSELPDIYEWLKAITDELGMLADRFETPQVVSFLTIRSKLSAIEQKYKTL
jgi:hypothetical protein